MNEEIQLVSKYLQLIFTLRASLPGWPEKTCPKKKVKNGKKKGIGNLGRVVHDSRPSPELNNHNNLHEGCNSAKQRLVYCQSQNYYSESAHD